SPRRVEPLKGLPGMHTERIRLAAANSRILPDDPSVLPPQHGSGGGRPGPVSTIHAPQALTLLGNSPVQHLAPTGVGDGGEGPDGKSYAWDWTALGSMVPLVWRRRNTSVDLPGSASENARAGFHHGNTEDTEVAR